MHAENKASKTTIEEHAAKYIKIIMSVNVSESGTRAAGPGVDKKMLKRLLKHKDYGHE